MQKLNILEWTERHRQEKIRWARQLLTSENATWATRALLWAPDPWKFHRAHGRPRRRWSDDITEALAKLHISTAWEEAVKDKATFDRLLSS